MVPRAQTRVFYHTTSTKYSRLDQWQREGVEEIKENSVLCIRSTFLGFFIYELKEAPGCGEIFGSIFIVPAN